MEVGPFRHVEGHAVKIRQNHVEVCMWRVVRSDGNAEIRSDLIPIAIGDDIVKRLVRIVGSVAR